MRKFMDDWNATQCIPTTLGYGAAILERLITFYRLRWQLLIASSTATLRESVAYSSLDLSPAFTTPKPVFESPAKSNIA